MTDQDGAMELTLTTGQDGIDGQDGAIGPTGPAGQDGIRWYRMEQSVPRVQAGQDGVDGQDGAIGPTGPAGQDGVLTDKMELQDRVHRELPVQQEPYSIHFYQ